MKNKLLDSVSVIYLSPQILATIPIPILKKPHKPSQWKGIELWKETFNKPVISHAENSNSLSRR